MAIGGWEVSYRF